MEITSITFSPNRIYQFPTTTPSIILWLQDAFVGIHLNLHS